MQVSCVADVVHTVKQHWWRYANNGWEDGNFNNDERKRRFRQFQPADSWSMYVSDVHKFTSLICVTNFSVLSDDCLTFLTSSELYIMLKCR